MFSKEKVITILIFALAAYVTYLMVSSNGKYIDKREFGKDKVIAINPNKDLRLLMTQSLVNCTNALLNSHDEKTCVESTAKNITFKTGISYTKKDLDLTISLMKEVNS